MIREGKLFKVATGLYSDTPDWSDIEVVLAKYPNAVVTLQSAYYYYELSDSIPEVFHLATDRDASKIYDERIVQHFMPKGTIATSWSRATARSSRAMPMSRSRTP